VRWAVRATLTLGVAASVLANILHALPNPISQAIAAWPPLALLLAVELISRVPVLHRWLALARLGATAAIAGIAAWVSYWHMAGVAARYGETGTSAYLLPLSVDGLIIVASICLVELGGRIRTAEAEAEARAGAVAGAGAGAVAGAAQSAAGAAPAGTASTRTAAKTAPRAAAASRQEKPTSSRAGRAASRAGTASSRGETASPRPKSAAKPRRPVTETVALAAQIEAKRPDLSEADVAQQLGITPARLRAVRRQARQLEQDHDLELAA
jgi:hypothetical protein